MANTYKLISKQTVGAGGAGSITFSSIPQTYTHLKIVYSSRTDNASIGQSVGVQLNGTTSGYSWLAFWGGGSSTPSSYGSSQGDMYVGETVGAQATSLTFGNGEFIIPNYTNGWYKIITSTAAGENNGSGNVFFTSALSGVGSAVTSVTVRPYSGTQTFQQYSTFYLYGISNS